MPVREQRHDYPLMNDLSALYRYVDAWRAGKPVQVLQRKVQACRETYGPARADDDTLAAWLELAALVRLHRRLLLALQTGGMRELETEWVMAYTALVERQTIDEDENTRRRRLTKEGARRARGPFAVRATPMLSNLDAVEETVLNELELIRAWAGRHKTAKGVRLAVADGLYDTFGGHLHLDHSYPRPIFQAWGVRVFCSAAVWLRYALAHMWRYGTELKVCPSCQTLFAPERKDTVYCQNACKQRAHKARVARPQTL